MMFKFIDLKENEPVVCTFMGQYQNVGTWKKTVFGFRGEDGEPFHLWGTVVLKHVLYGIPFKTKIKLTYTGMVKEDEMRHPAKNFIVEIIDP